MSVTVDNIQIEPMRVLWGESRPLIQKITCGADASSSLQNKYFFIYSADGSKNYVWFNVGAAGVDPTPAGSFTGVEVAIAVDATSSAVATAVQAALDALADYVATVSGNIVTVTGADNGYAPAAHDSASASSTGFTFAVTQQGSTELDVGATDGEIEFTPTEDLVDVVAHQHGTLVLDQIRTGSQDEVTINFKETSKSQLVKIFTQGGASYYPAQANNSEVVGWGTSKQFLSVSAQAMKLRLHPVRLPLTDRSKDYTFHKAYPNLDSFSFSGEDVLMIPLTFKLFPDFTKNAAINTWVYGDSSQTLT